MSANEAPPDIRLYDQHSFAKRTLIALIGALIVALAISDLGRTLRPFTWSSLSFLIAVLGAGSVSGVMLLGGLFGDDSEWTLSSDRLRIERRSTFGRRVTILRGADLAGTVIREHEWDTQQPSYSVILDLRGRRAIASPQFKSKRLALAFQSELAARLGAQIISQ